MSTGPVDEGLPLEAPLLVGFGVTSQAVAAALVARGHSPVVVEDRPADAHRRAAAELGVTLLEAPSASELAAAVERASLLVPSPGVPDHHPVFAAAAEAGLPMASEFDLAQAWDDRPVVAITGTNGKTTVTVMVTDALERSGRRAEAVGNTELPFVEAIGHSAVEVFVVEASSFRLAHSAAFRPDVAAWLNFAPDHLDAHASLELYEQAKAAIWADPKPGATIVANLDDPVVVRYLPRPQPGTDVTVVTFGTSSEAVAAGANWRLDQGSDERRLSGPAGPLVPVSELARRQPHDLSNALATAAIATAAGATREGIVATLRGFDGLAHRLEFLGCWRDVGWYNDSKATVPHATVAAVGGFQSVVLIAGGRNKGLSLEPLRRTVPPVRSVVAIGDAAPEIEDVFAGLVPVTTANSMEEAVHQADRLARAGDTVLLSPACTSFDWYPSYAERGLAFSRLVRQEVAAS